MVQPRKHGVCSLCGFEGHTNIHYNTPQYKTDKEGRTELISVGNNKIELCRECYDKMVVEEQIDYWKNHIAEENKRTGN